MDLHLAGVLRQDGSPDQSRELCMEAIRLEREQRIESVKGLSTAHLDARSACIVEAAKAFVEQSHAGAPEDFGLLDLVVRLLDLLRLVHVLETLPASQAAVPADFSVDNIVLGIGNALYRKELGLRFNQVKAPRP